MATWYVNSAASGTGAGTSWTNACTTLAAAITLSAAGDDFDVASTHAETTASALTLTFKGTAAAPNRVFSCDTTNSPAQASDLLAGASVTTTGASGMTLQGYFYCYGVVFNCGTGTTAATLVVAGAGEQTFDGCAFNLLVTAVGNSLMVGSGGITSQKATLLNSTVNFHGSASSSLSANCGQLVWKNTPSAITSINTLTSLFGIITRSSLVMLDGVDLTGVASGKNIFSAQATWVVAQILNCKLTSGVVVAATPSAPGCSVDLINSDSGATGYRQERWQYPGTQTAETTVVLGGGASDGVQPISWKVATNANASRLIPFECFQIAQWFSAGLGSSHTITFQALGPAGLTSADVWADVEYLGGASAPLSSKATSAPATQLSAGSSLPTTGTGTWGGSTGDTAYTLAVSFTPQIAGYVRATVRVAKPSVTLWIDPSPVIV